MEKRPVYSMSMNVVQMAVEVEMGSLPLVANFLQVLIFLNRVSMGVGEDQGVCVRDVGGNLVIAHQYVGRPEVSKKLLDCHRCIPNIFVM